MKVRKRLQKAVTFILIGITLFNVSGITEMNVLAAAENEVGTETGEDVVNALDTEGQIPGDISIDDGINDESDDALLDDASGSDDESDEDVAGEEITDQPDDVSTVIINSPNTDIQDVNEQDDDPGIESLDIGVMSLTESPDIGIMPLAVDPSTRKADMRVGVLSNSSFNNGFVTSQGPWAHVYYSAKWSGAILNNGDTVLNRDQIVYCYEPKKVLASDNNYNEAGSIGSKNLLKNLTTSRITEKNVIFKMLGRVLKVCGPTTQTASTVLNSAPEATRYIAAQVIIWQIVEGDMDANFVCHSNNWNANRLSGEGDLTTMKYWSTAPSGGRSVKSWYDEWITKLQKSKEIPSFSSKNENAPTEHEMTSNTLTLTDNNKVLQYMKFTPSNSSVTLTVSGNTLTIKNPNNVDFTVKVTNTICDGAKEPVPIVTTNTSTGSNRQGTLLASGTNLADPVYGYFKIKASVEGNLSLAKIDAEDNTKYLTGAVFGVYDTSNTKLGTMTDNGNGTYSYTGLPAGTYTVKEETAPAGYHLDTGSYSITVSESKTYVVDNSGHGFINTPIKGKLFLTKVDAEDNTKKLTGAVFTIYDSADQVVGTMTDNGDGTYSYSDLPYGDYTVRETTPPTGYLADPNSYSVTVADSITYTIANSSNLFTDQIIKGNVQVTKKSASGNLLSGAYFAIFDSGNKLVGMMNDNSNGTYSFTGLPYGNYTVREMAAPDRYLTDSTPVNFAIQNNGETVSVSPSGSTSFINNPQLGDLKIKKTVEQDDLLHSSLAGYQFRVTCAAVGYDSTHTTDTNGEIYLENLPVGTYTIQEVAKEGTNVDGSNFQFEIPSPITVEVRANQLDALKIESRAEAGYGCSIRGWYRNRITGMTKAYQTSGISLSNQDIVTPPGKTMVFSAEVFVENNCYWGLQRRNQLVNSTTVGQYHDAATATSNTGTLLKAGQWTTIYFTYTNPNSVPLREASNIYLKNNGAVFWFEMRNIRMTIADNGVVDRTGTVNAVSGNAVTNVSVNNNLRRGDLTIKKVDAMQPSIKIAGVKMLLEKKVYYLSTEAIPAGSESDANGSFRWVKVSEETTDGTGKIIWNDLVVGDYRITEIKAAAGYQLLTEPVMINLPYQPDGDPLRWSYETNIESIDAEITIGNQPIYVMPSSGGHAPLLYIGGVIMALTGIIGIILSKRRKSDY